MQKQKYNEVQKQSYRVRNLRKSWAVNSIVKEFEAYYLLYDNYPPNGWENFINSFNIEYSCSYAGDYLRCTNFTIDIYSHGYQLIVAYDKKMRYGYGRYLNVSDKPLEELCLAEENDSVSNNMCQGFGGELDGKLPYGGAFPLNTYKI